MLKLFTETHICICILYERLTVTGCGDSFAMKTRTPASSIRTIMIAGDLVKPWPLASTAAKLSFDISFIVLWYFIAAFLLDAHLIVVIWYTHPWYLANGYCIALLDNFFEFWYVWLFVYILIGSSIKNNQIDNQMAISYSTRWSFCVHTIQ